MSSKDKKVFDFIVIGSGINGLCSAWQLTEENPNAKVLVLEQFPFGHSRGSSHGHSRITRRLYTEDYYCALMKKAYILWEKLEKLSDSKLYINCQTVGIGPENVIDEYQQALFKSGAKFELHDSESISRHYPHFKTFKDSKFIIDPDGGLLLADKCLKALHKILSQRGVILHDCEKVEKISPYEDSSGVDVVTNKGFYSAKALIICANTWTKELLRPLGVDIPTQATKVCLTYWNIHPDSQYKYDPQHFPTWTFHEGEHHVFGTPELEYPGCVKVTYHDGVDCSPNRRDNNGYNEPGQQYMIQFVKKFLPDLIPVPAITETCLYDSLPNRIYLIDQHPKFKNIVFACGFSGQGFKTGPPVGQILARMVLGRDIDFDLTPFLLERFHLKAKL